MGKIDVSQWQEYKISQLFSVRPSKYVRENGKVVSNRKLLDDGPNPVVVNSSVNNGIGGTTSYEPTEHGNVITYSDTVDGNTIFYQAKPFVGYSHVKVMEPKEKRNPVEMIFLTAVIGRRLSDGNYDYTNKMTTNRVLNTTIKLPALSDGSPDWQYMDEYIAKLATQAHTNISLLRQQQKKAPTVNIDRWKEFSLSHLFHAEFTDGDNKPNRLLEDDDGHPLIGATSECFGCVGYYQTDTKVFPAKSLTWDRFGHCFVQPKSFQTMAHGNVMVLKPKMDHSYEALLFVASIINRISQMRDYGYGRTLTLAEFKRSTIKLPALSDGSPDWQYMDNYISSIQQVQKKRVARLTSIVKK